MDADLMDTVETIRADDYAELDAALVAQLLQIERDQLDLRLEVHAKLGKAIDAFLSRSEAK